MLCAMLRHLLDPGQPLLGGRFPLPLDAPFLRADLAATGVQSWELSWLCAQGYLRRLLETVYVAAQVPDTLDLRVAALNLVVPPDAVITDRSAGWLHGAQMILAPGDHLAVPPVSVFLNREGARLRNDLVDSGERTLAQTDVMDVRGLQVTTPLRTACDLGRLLSRDWAFAALDSMLRLGAFDRMTLVHEVERFGGMRGVRQLRGFAPRADPRSDSPAESVARLRWQDVFPLHPPQPQVEVPTPFGWSYWLDLAIEDLLFAVEYDGEEWHRRTTKQKRKDATRRGWLRDKRGWVIHPVTKENLWGPQRDFEELLVGWMTSARRRF